nr:glycine betaine ABC transporter substrate-binding protein [Virgibacillus necropolis]
MGSKVPKGIFGEEQHAATIVRKGLKDELPNAYTILDRFHWEVSDIESLKFRTLKSQ